MLKVRFAFWGDVQKHKVFQWFLNVFRCSVLACAGYLFLEGFDKEIQWFLTRYIVFSFLTSIDPSHLNATIATHNNMIFIKIAFWK